MANGLFGGGTGATATPYIIEDFADLNAVRNSKGKAYIVANNIDMAGHTWVPIGDASSIKFTGVFDGNNKSISNFTIDSTAPDVGLFGYIDGSSGVVKNVIMPNVNVHGKNDSSVGALVGKSNGNVLNCRASGVVNGEIVSTANAVGGLIGYMTSAATVFDSYADVAVTGTCDDTAGVKVSNLGGLVGLVGGIVWSWNILRCFATGDVKSVKGAANIGGLIGYQGTSMQDCYATGNVESGPVSNGVNNNVGALVGQSKQRVLNCYETGNVIVATSGDTHVGLSLGDKSTDTSGGGNIADYTYWNSNSSITIGGVVQADKGVGTGGDTTTAKTSVEFPSQTFLDLLNAHKEANTTWVFVPNYNGGKPTFNNAAAIVTPPSKPSAPTNLSVVAGSVTATALDITWDLVTGCQYNLYSATVSGGPYTLVSSAISAPPYHVQSLTSSTTYYFVVTATNANGESVYSNQTTATTSNVPQPIPPAPTGLTVGAVTSTSINLSWDAEPQAGSFIVHQSPNGAAPWSVVASGVTGTTYVVNGLAPNTLNYYQITAVNATGESGASNVVSGSTALPPKPSAPTGVTVGAVTVTTADLSWNAVAGVDSYNVYMGTTSAPPEAYSLIASGIVGTSYQATGLEGGTDYYFVVRSYYSGAESNNSSEVHARTIVPMPGSTVVTFGDIQNTYLEIYWNSVPYATGYNIYKYTTSGVPQLYASAVYGTYQQITGLTPSTTYYFEVSAVNSAGEGVKSPEVSATTLAVATPRPPNPPGNLRIGNIHDTTLDLVWDQVVSRTSYSVYRGTVAGQTTELIASGLLDYNYQAQSLTPGTTYYFTVTAFNNVGESAKSNEAFGTTTPATGVPTPTLSVVARLRTQIALSWGPIVGAESYNLYRALTYDGAPVLFKSVVGTQYTDKVLIPNTSYFYWVSAVVSGVESNYSTQMEGHTLGRDSLAYPPDSGPGSANQPIMIRTPEDLDSIRTFPDAYYQLANDIDLGVSPWNTGTGWSPLNYVCCRLNGAGFKILGLTINRPTEDYIGLFGDIDSCEITNLNITGANVIGKWYTGILVGHLLTCTVSNCIIQGIIHSPEARGLGGVIGWSFRYSNINDCSFSGDLSCDSGSYVGGFIGYTFRDMIHGCHTSGSTFNVSAGAVGGFAGYIGSDFYNSQYLPQVHQCYSSVLVDLPDAVVTNDVGGFVGIVEGMFTSIAECYADGGVGYTAAKNCGGFVGYFKSGEIRDSYSHGAVRGTAGYCGGFVGEISGSMLNCYCILYSFTGDTNGPMYGHSSGGSIQRCYTLDTNLSNTDPIFYKDWNFFTIWYMVSNPYIPMLRMGASSGAITYVDTMHVRTSLGWKVVPVLNKLPSGSSVPIDTPSGKKYLLILE